MRKASIVLIAALAACAAKSTQRDIPGKMIYMPDGSHGYAITCDGKFSDVTDCQSRASEICLEQGYKVINSQFEASPIFQQGVFGGAKRSMTIRCNTEDGLSALDEPVQR